jgi:hypothetical protein
MHSNSPIRQFPICRTPTLRDPLPRVPVLINGSDQFGNSRLAMSRGVEFSPYQSPNAETPKSDGLWFSTPVLTGYLPRNSFTIGRSSGIRETSQELQIVDFLPLEILSGSFGSRFSVAQFPLPSKTPIYRTPTMLDPLTRVPQMMDGPKCIGESHIAISLYTNLLSPGTPIPRSPILRDPVPRIPPVGRLRSFREIADRGFLKQRFYIPQISDERNSDTFQDADTCPAEING